MTERLYYDNPDQHEFDATVLDVTTRDGRSIVVLDRTAFYPTSGGQPFDTGTLADEPVVEVGERDDGTIEHVLGGSACSVGQQVHGRIDRARRLDHMQQHTGQHLLSAAFDRLHGVRTESFHLGSATSTIDLAREVTPDEIARAESEANRIVWEDRAVSIRYASPEEAAAMSLRKPPSEKRLRPARGAGAPDAAAALGWPAGGERGEAAPPSAPSGGGAPLLNKERRWDPASTERSLRLIDVADFDLSACGGTHVSRTGRIGMVAVAGWERFKRGTRVEFVCGGRALERFRRLRDVVSASIALLSVAPDELGAAIARAQSDNKDLRRELKRVQERLAAFEAESLFDGADAGCGAALVARAMEGYDAAGLRSLASTGTARPGRVAIVCSTVRPIALAVARSRDVALDAGALLRAVAQRFGGRGGGNAELAQGGGLDASADDVLAEARRLAREMLGS